ncbi:MAG: 6-hydroxycyclohex-1-ene-1-carbonyl-CoA dehydrogenase [Thermoanaerobaculia bacterium]
MSTKKNSSDPYGFRLIESGRPLERWEMPPPEPESLQVVVEVAGCGVCHTDVSFAVDGVPTRHPLPLVLGHEISGRVVAAGNEASEWMDRSVIVPAVVPCGGCDACAAGRPTICREQFMPGNHGHGGFATHVTVPSYGLCAVPENLPAGLSLPVLSVVADAVTTPLEAIRRAGLSSGDVAVFVGVGGVGGFGVQIAAAVGAAAVAIDIDRSRLELASRHGAELALDATKLDGRALKTAVRDFTRQAGCTGVGRKIFETSGTAAGQRTAWALLDPGAHLAVVGFTPEKLELRLSNLMAFDAVAQGNWGSSPERYPEALELVLGGKVALEPYVEMHPLDRAPEVLQAVAEHRLSGRAILVPSLRVS